MSIIRKLGLAYLFAAVISTVLVIRLGYHEFVAEPREFARMGFPEIHKDTWAEFFAVSIFGLIPLLLGFGWWWMHRVLTPLALLTESVDGMDADHPIEPLRRTGKNDEVDRLAAAFNAMTKRIDRSMGRIRAFSASASHELKTPLTVMRVQLESKLRNSEKYGMPREKNAWIESQLDEIQRLTTIVDSLLLLTGGGMDETAMNRSRVRLRDLVAEAANDAAVLGGEQKLEVFFEEGEDLEMEGDRHRLRQLLLILMDNAVKYNRMKGRIEISLKGEAKSVKLIVRNTSLERLPDQASTLLNPFVRGSGSSTAQGGSGLGLSIARTIVESHSGTIRIVGEEDGWVAVRVRLPLGA